MEVQKIKLICYGLGRGFEDFVLHLNTDYAEIVGVIDQNVKRIGYPVLEVVEVNEIVFDYVVICSRNHKEEMAAALIRAKVPQDKITAAPNCMKLDSSYQNNALMRILLKPQHVTGHLIWGHQLPFQNCDSSDYVRKATLTLIAKMIQKYKVNGALAEVGVCTGAFAKLINELFPQRELYLFDTFEGFDERDLTNKKEFDRSKTNIFALYNSVKDTSVQSVLNNMPYKNKCIVRKGYFPDTAEGIDMETRFAFVSLDADLYNPIYAGLEFFYPRMSKGGIIMVHDYNSAFLQGVARAVDEFSVKYTLFPIPIPDECGSVLIVHP